MSLRTITVLVTASITREARHPAAARLFMNYLASDEGQKEVLSMDKPPALPDGGAPAGPKPLASDAGAP